MESSAPNSFRPSWFDAVTDAIIVVDLSWHIQDWNAAAERIYGWYRTETLGQPLGQRIIVVRFLSDDTTATAFATLQRDGEWRGACVQRARDGHELVVEAAVQLLRDPHGTITGYIAINRDITLRTQAETTLRESEERFRRYFELGLVGIAITSPTKGLLEVNDELCSILGYTRSELMQIPWSELTHPDDLAADVARFNQVLAGVIDGYTLEKRWIRKDGQVIDTTISVKCLRCADGTVDYFVALLQDITARKQAEQALRQSEARFATAFSVSPAAMSISRLSDGRFIDVNTSYQHLFGYTRDELVGQTGISANIYTSPEQRGTLVRLLHERGSIQNLELELRTKSGELRTVLCSVQTLPIDGETCALASMVDITKRKQAEATLQRSAKRLLVLADTSHALAEAGADEQAVLALVARTSAEVFGSLCTLRMFSEDGQWLTTVALHHAGVDARDAAEIARASTPMPVEVVQSLLHTLQHTHAHVLEAADIEHVRNQMSTETRPLFEYVEEEQHLVAPLRVGSQMIGILVMMRSNGRRVPFTEDDVHLAHELANRAGLAIGNARLVQQLADERARLAQRVDERTADLRQANAELARAVRLKDEFLANMSHELRTPLNAILGRSQALQEEIYGPLTPPQVEALHGVEQSGQHLLSLINDILDVARIESGHLTLEWEEVVVSDLCRASVQMLAQVALKKHIRLTSTVDSAVSVLLADVRRLKQILVNLLSNAVKFTPPGGSVGLEVRGGTGGQMVTFTVWDTGIGIAEADVARLFKPFVQIDSSLSRQYDGTGLGLALVRRLAEAHGGSVGVESTPGQGSRFSVTLPWHQVESSSLSQSNTALDTSQPTIQSTPVIDESLAVQRGHILLAEDNESNIELMEYVLQAKGYTVEVARDGEEALARAQEGHPDLILMDIPMPGMDGLEAIRQIRSDARVRDIPIIALTALAMPGDRERCLQAGANDHLTKPVDLSALLTSIPALLASAKPAM